MTVYEELCTARDEAERAVAEYARKVHNAPYMEYSPGSSIEGSVKIYEGMIEVFSRRAAALSAAIASLPVEVAESEV